MNTITKYADFNQLYQGLKENEQDARQYIYNRSEEIVSHWSESNFLELLWIVEDGQIPSEKKAVYKSITEKLMIKFQSSSELPDSFPTLKNTIIETATNKLHTEFPPFWNWTLEFNDPAWIRIKKDFGNKLIFWFYKKGCSQEKAKDLNDKTYYEILEYFYKKNRNIDLDNNSSKGLKSFFFGFALNIWRNSFGKNSLTSENDFEDFLYTIRETGDYIITRELNEHNNKMVEELFKKAKIKELDKKILFEYYYEEKSFDEIASEIKETSEFCRKRAQRAKEKLKDTFNKYFQGDYKDLIF